MKITRLPIMAAPLIFLSSVNATLTKTEKFEITVHPSTPACGITPGTTKAHVGDMIPYEITGPKNGLVPFINITEWEINRNNLNPNLVYMDGIAYKFGEYGIPVAFENESNIGHFQFSMKQRPGVSIPPTTDKTTLTMTLTCFDNKDITSYNKAAQYWLENGGTEKFIEYTSKLGWDFKDGNGSQTIITDPNKIPSFLLHTPRFPTVKILE